RPARAVGSSPQPLADRLMPDECRQENHAGRGGGQRPGKAMSIRVRLSTELIEDTTGNDEQDRQAAQPRRECEPENAERQAGVEHGRSAGAAAVRPAAGRSLEPLILFEIEDEDCGSGGRSHACFLLDWWSAS